MAVIRLILLVVVLGGLTLLLVQNLSPTLPLVFLGMRTQPLPLALWVLLSIAAGAFTSLLIAALFKIANYVSAQQAPKTSFTSNAAPPRVKTTTSKKTTQPTSSPKMPVNPTEYTTSNDFDDWETDPNQGDDWDYQESRRTSSPKTYENQQVPKNASPSDSVYSYSSQEPKNTGVGKTESIYDADYRVIIPPYQPSTTNQTDDDDWDFFEDEDLDDENKPPRQ